MYVVCIEILPYYAMLAWTHTFSIFMFAFRLGPSLPWCPAFLDDVHATHVVNLPMWSKHYYPCLDDVQASATSLKV